MTQAAHERSRIPDTSPDTVSELTASGLSIYLRCLSVPDAGVRRVPLLALAKEFRSVSVGSPSFFVAQDVR